MNKLLLATLAFVPKMAMAAHYDAFYHNPTFWVSISFLVVVVALAKPVSKAVNNMLHGNVNKVLETIQNASSLRDDAQKLLQNYQKKEKGVKSEVELLLKDAKEQTELLKNESLKKLEENLLLKEKEIASRLELMQAQAKEEIVATISSKTIENVKNHLAKKQANDFQEKLVNKVIDGL